MGYENYESYRPWLRDEFSFRCVYCLSRETWTRFTSNFEIDHFKPIINNPALAGDYTNLLYSCTTCNTIKGDQQVPDPLQVLLASAVMVSEDGTIRAQTSEAAELIEMLDLDDEPATEFREMWQQIIQLAYIHKRELFRKLMSFPDDLPNLTRLKPPHGNLKPGGLEQSHFRRKERGTLPEFY